MMHDKFGNGWKKFILELIEYSYGISTVLLFFRRRPLINFEVQNFVFMIHRQNIFTRPRDTVPHQKISFLLEHCNSTLSTDGAMVPLITQQLLVVEGTILRIRAITCRGRHYCVQIFDISRCQEETTPKNNKKPLAFQKCKNCCCCWS